MLANFNFFRVSSPVCKIIGVGNFCCQKESLERLFRFVPNSSGIASQMDFLKQEFLGIQYVIIKLNEGLGLRMLSPGIKLAS